MRHRSSEQAVQYCDQKNAVLFWFQSIKRILAYAFHSTWSIALIAFAASRILVRYAPAYIPNDLERGTASGSVIDRLENHSYHSAAQSTILLHYRKTDHQPRRLFRNLSQ